MQTELTFYPFPQVQPPGGKELLLITSSKVFRKGDLCRGQQWRMDGDPGWNGREYEYALKSLNDVIFWAELPDAVALVNNALGVGSPVEAVASRVWTEAEMLAAIRKVGGIVHSDGNVFFTNWGRMLAAVDELAKAARGVTARPRWPEGAAFVDAEGRFYDENAVPLPGTADGLTPKGGSDGVL